MKVLKPLSSGLIAYEDFSGPVQPPLIDRSVNLNNGSFILKSGSIDIDAFSFKDVVFELKNNFIPQDNYHLGGVKLKKGSDTMEFYEYAGAGIAVPYVRVVKNGDVYTGYASLDGEVWEDKGYVAFPHVETIGVSSNTDYELEYIKVYKSRYITLHSVIAGWRVEVGNISKNISSDSVNIELPYYPYTGTFIVYNQFNNPVVESEITVWGGDEYICTANVELFIEEDTPLSYEAVMDLGNLNDGIIDCLIKAKNMNDFTTGVTIRVADYSPFGNWVKLSHEHEEDFKSIISMSMTASQERYFWLRVERPNEALFMDFDFRKTKCLFYLEVI